MPGRAGRPAEVARGVKSYRCVPAQPAAYYTLYAVRASIMLSPPTRWQPFVILVVLFLSTCGPAYSQSSQLDRPARLPQKTESSQPDTTSSLLTALKPQTETTPYCPITPRQRASWILSNSIGPAHLLGGTFSAAFGTALDRPKEDGPHWAGFGER